MEQVLFRCSQLGDLMTGTIGLTGKQEYELKTLIDREHEFLSGNEKKKLTPVMEAKKAELESKSKDITVPKTVQTLCKDMWLRNTLGYQKIVQTKELMKGHLCERESMDLIQQVLGGEPRIPNRENRKNEFITGTCDIALQREPVVEDIKNSWDVRTFMNVADDFNDPKNTGYIWQGDGYLWLWEAEEYRLIYTLNKIPKEMMLDEDRRLWYMFGQDDNNDDYKRAVEQLYHNNNLIDSLSPEQRVKKFVWKRDKSKEEQIKVRAGYARKFYNTITL